MYNKKGFRNITNKTPGKDKNIYGGKVSGFSFAENSASY